MKKNKKKTQYALRDYLFKFWYEFVPKDTRVIEMGQGEIYYQKAVKSVLHYFMGTVFEEMCRYYTLKQGIHVVFGSCITSVGTRWGEENVTDKTGSKRSQLADIDVVALSDIDNVHLQNTEYQSMYSFRYLDIQIGLNQYQMRTFYCLHWILFTSNFICG